MSYNHIRSIIERKIALAIQLDHIDTGGLSVSRVSWQNADFVPPNDCLLDDYVNQAWINVQLAFGESSYATLIGSDIGGFDKQNGSLILNVFTPAGSGAGGNYTIANSIKHLFNRETVDCIIFDASSGPNVVVPPTPEVTLPAPVVTPSGPEAVFFETSTTIPFSAYVEHID